MELADFGRVCDTQGGLSPRVSQVGRGDTNTLEGTGDTHRHRWAQVQARGQRDKIRGQRDKTSGQSADGWRSRGCDWWDTQRDSQCSQFSALKGTPGVGTGRGTGLEGQKGGQRDKISGQRDKISGQRDKNQSPKC